MNFVFDIAGHPCVADHVRMQGNTIVAAFDHSVLATLADAFDLAHVVSLAGMSPLDVTYSVQDYRADEGGCCATFSVNSAADRVLH